MNIGAFKLYFSTLHNNKIIFGSTTCLRVTEVQSTDRIYGYSMFSYFNDIASYLGSSEAYSHTESSNFYHKSQPYINIVTNGR